jgi:uncharacterized membrane protein
MGTQRQIALSLWGRIGFLLNRLRQKLWVKPLILCVISVLSVFVASLADWLGLPFSVPDISADSLETLLRIISSSMLVIAVFAVGSMISAYASAANNATPRSFPVVVADDISQNALSAFIGAFIFGIVGLIALLNGVYGRAGRFCLFAFTLIVFTIVILSFVTWVDRIARLGRLGNTVTRLEAVAARALANRARNPTLGALRSENGVGMKAIYPQEVGYIQRIDLAALQLYAEEADLHVYVMLLPGSFVSPRRPLVTVSAAVDDATIHDLDQERITDAFVIGTTRTFYDDPRYSLVVLSEIGSRALSPAVNDPGTAIHVLGSLVRLLSTWAEVVSEAEEKQVLFDRILLPEIAVSDMFEDAFHAIARDGASMIEVAIRLQKSLAALAALAPDLFRDAAMTQAHRALRHGEKCLRLEEDVERLRRAAAWMPGERNSGS